MDKKMLEAFAREAAKSIKTESDLEDFRKMLTKVTIETALNVELDEHLGYEKHAITATENARNGYSTDDGSVLIEIPRDRDAFFEPNKNTTLKIQIDSRFQKGFFYCLI